MSQPGYSRLAGEPEDYESLGLDPELIAPWEDGQRAATDPGHYEWWYFDCHLEDGTSIVVAFSTKPNVQPNLPLTPYLTIDITRPDGTTINKVHTDSAENFAASRDRCDVRIGDNRFTGDLHSYRIKATIDDISVDIDLAGEVRAWRPHTGHAYYVRDGEAKLLAWLVSVPQGRVSGAYSIGDTQYEAKGAGYHDHNWGDIPMWEIVHDWYWGRAKIGPYTVTASYIIAAEAYGYSPVKTFLVARDGAIIVDDETKVSVATQGNFTDERTGKPVAGVLTYTYSDGDTEYVVVFKHARTIVQNVFTDKMPEPQRTAALEAGMDSAYLRFEGIASIEKRENGVVVERFEDPALWEQMYFGHARTPDI